MIDLRVSLCGFTSFDEYRKARARRMICTILVSAIPSLSPIHVKASSSARAPDRLVTVLRRLVMDVREMSEDGDEGEFRAIFFLFLDCRRREGKHRHDLRLHGTGYSASHRVDR